MDLMKQKKQFKESNKTCVVCHRTFKHQVDFPAIANQKDGFDLICSSCIIKERFSKDEIIKTGIVDVVQKVFVRCVFRHDIDNMKDIPPRCKNFKPHIEKCVGKDPKDDKCPFLRAIICDLDGVDLDWQRDDEKRK